MQETSVQRPAIGKLIELAVERFCRRKPTPLRAYTVRLCEYVPRTTDVIVYANSPENAATAAILRGRATPMNWHFRPDLSAGTFVTAMHDGERVLAAPATHATPQQCETVQQS